jgi:hypothetical protein
MAASNLALAFVTLGAVAFMFGIEWLLEVRARLPMRPESQATYASLAGGCPSEDSNGSDSI